MPQGVVHVKSKLVGKPNVYNILAAAGDAAALGVPIDADRAGSAEARRRAGPIRGRRPRRATTSRSSSITRIPTTRCATCSRPRGRCAPRRLITVFGAGGDRDRTKRPLMGMVAARLSDVVVITSDNPRGEDPARIIDEVEARCRAGDAAGQRRSR